jgi:hypothetical protein
MVSTSSLVATTSSSQNATTTTPQQQQHDDNVDSNDNGNYDNENDSSNQRRKEEVTTVTTVTKKGLLLMHNKKWRLPEGIKKYSVSFGVSGNFHGNVYTTSTASTNVTTTTTTTAAAAAAISTDTSGNNNIHMAAMIGVLPEHVPEGILNLIRSHRPFIEHVRVVISDDNDDYDSYDDDNDNDDSGDVDNEEVDDGEVDDEDDGANSNDKKKKKKNNSQQKRTFLVLVQFLNEVDTIEFVDDLNGKPYISFNDREICHIERVIKLETIQPKQKVILLKQKEDQQLQQQQQQQQQQNSLLFHTNFGGSGNNDSNSNNNNNDNNNDTTTSETACTSDGDGGGGGGVSSISSSTSDDAEAAAASATGTKFDDNNKEKCSSTSTSSTSEDDGLSTKDTTTKRAAATIKKCNNDTDNENNIQNCAVCLEHLGLPTQQHQQQQQQQQQQNQDHSGSTTALASVASSYSSTTTVQQQQQQQQQQSGPSSSSSSSMATIATTNLTAISNTMPLLTTVCNHTFHLDCLSQCTGPCPVCRYDHSGLNEMKSQCHTCDTTENNYICLICGIISCRNAIGVNSMASASATSASSPYNDNYATTHAGQHYKETLHAYALDTETQHVYDFCGQGWVHRLVQSKEDGKIVEVNDPNNNQFNNSSNNAGGAYYNNNYGNNNISNGYYNGGGERSLTPGLSDVQEEEIVHRKLEGAAEQYNTLLKNQLEQQRTFYEERIREIEQNQDDNKKKKAATDVGQPQDLISILKQNRKQLSNRLVTIQKRSKKAIDNIQFLKDMNESLDSNKPQLKHSIQQAGRERNESNDMIQKYLPSLEEQLSSLMLQLTSSSATTEGE